MAVSLPQLEGPDVLVSDESAEPTSCHDCETWTPPRWMEDCFSSSRNFSTHWKPSLGSQLTLC